MNKLEREILAILEEDSRTDAAQIAVMLGEDEARVREAVRAMEKRGTIVKYTAIANLDEEEDECVEALIEVKIAPRGGSGFDGVAEEIACHEEVKTLYLMSGAPTTFWSLWRRAPSSRCRASSRSVSPRSTACCPPPPFHSQKI